MPADPTYADFALEAFPRLIGKLDREPDSATFGSFDREHWSWKFRDFPIAPLQMGIYPLALVWRHQLPGSPYHGNDRLREWIAGAVMHTMGRQKRNGAYDAFAPNDFDPGPTLGICYSLAAVAALLQEHLPSPIRARLIDSVHRGAQFGLRHEQTHAFASNHWALFACAFLEASKLTGDGIFERRAKEIVTRVLEMQSADGCYSEYSGADPGYESLGIGYLARYWRATRDPALLDSMRRAVEFFAHCVHPDGSVGGVYGSRHTQLYFPAGFEILADEVPDAAAVATFMRHRLTRGNVVSPANCDAHNLSSLITSYVEAALSIKERSNVRNLPCERTGHARYFSAAGIFTIGTTRYYAVVSVSKGGVCRVFDRARETLAYQDAGYVARSGSRQWISQALGSGSPTGVDDRSLIIDARFREQRQPAATPLNYLLLRFLSLTVFRSVALGAWIRARIVRRLTDVARPGPLALKRAIVFEPEAVVIADDVQSFSGRRIDQVTLASAHTGIHMGSAKYYHASDDYSVGALPGHDAQRHLAGSGRAHVRLRIEINESPRGNLSRVAADPTGAKHVPAQ